MRPPAERPGPARDHVEEVVSGYVRGAEFATLDQLRALLDVLRHLDRGEVDEARAVVLDAMRLVRAADRDRDTLEKLLQELDAKGIEEARHAA